MRGNSTWNTRFRAHTRVNPALFLAVPALNAFLLVAAFALFSTAWAKRPGVVVELPSGKADDGMRSSIHIVAQPVAGADAVRPWTGEKTVVTAAMIVIFDESHYDLRLESEVSGLTAALAAKISVSGETGIMLHIDASIAHGDTMALSRILRNAGAERLCFVIDTRHESNGG